MISLMSTRHFHSALCWVFITVVILSGCSSRAEGKPRIATDVVYGQGYVAEDEDAVPTLQPLLMDVMLPADKFPKPYPAVILIHGGGFDGGSKKDDRQLALANTLVAKGYACFLINYRLMKHHPPAPAAYMDHLSRAVHAAIVDAKTALRHVTAHAADYGIDPERIAVGGASAGAIAALGAGLSTAAPFTSDGADYPPPPENNPDTAARAAAIINLWGTADFFPELFSAQSPPIMTVHGGKDFRVGISLLPAENIDAKCKEFGIPHQYYPLPDEGHNLWKADIAGKPLATRVLEFLDAYLK
jgi:predicted esterase